MARNISKRDWVIPNITLYFYLTKLVLQQYKDLFYSWRRADIVAAHELKLQRG